MTSRFLAGGMSSWAASFSDDAKRKRERKSKKGGDVTKKKPQQKKDELVEEFTVKHLVCILLNRSLSLIS